MSTAQRIEAARDEAKSIENELRGIPTRSAERRAMQDRLRRLARQIAMLTEDQRDHNPDRKAKGQGE